MMTLLDDGRRRVGCCFCYSRSASLYDRVRRRDWSPLTNSQRDTATTELRSHRLMRSMLARSIRNVPLPRSLTHARHVDDALCPTGSERLSLAFTESLTDNFEVQKYTAKCCMKTKAPNRSDTDYNTLRLAKTTTVGGVV